MADIFSCTSVGSAHVDVVEPLWAGPACRTGRAGRRTGCCALRGSRACPTDPARHTRLPTRLRCSTTAQTTLRKNSQKRQALTRAMNAQKSLISAGMLRKTPFLHDSPKSPDRRMTAQKAARDRPEALPPSSLPPRLRRGSLSGWVRERVGGWWSVFIQ